MAVAGFSDIDVLIGEKLSNKKRMLIFSTTLGWIDDFSPLIEESPYFKRGLSSNFVPYRRLGSNESINRGKTEC